MLPIVHHPLYDAASVSDEHRFPMRKYTRLPIRLIEERLAYPNGFHLPELASRDELLASHSESYVDAVLNGTLDRQAQRKIGFEWSEDVSNRARASAGGTLLAARLALKTGAAANTAGGSHHASFESGAGFCVFNDVAFAAANLLKEGSVRNILIVDLDVHHGDGTARIFANENRVFTFSMHCQDNWPTEKPPSDLDIGLPKGMTDDAYLECVNSNLKSVFETSNADLVFYNAGVDIHRDDRLGHIDVSDEGIALRDKMVADFAQQYQIPIVGVLGGGYSKITDEVVERHVSMFRALSLE